MCFSGVSQGLSLVSSQTTGVGATYSVELNGSNTVEAGYNFTESRSILSSLIQTHSVEATYERRIGHPLALTRAAGRRFTLYAGGMERNWGASTFANASAS